MNALPDYPAVKNRIVIIGGGLSGLAVAHSVIRSAPMARPAEVLLLEAKDRLGGTIWTARRDGFTIEAGADSFITNKPWGVDLCRELGLGDRLIETDARHRRSFVVFRGRLVPVPEGFVMAAPSRLLPILTSPILSVPGKLRLLMDLVLPRLGSDQEESLASFVRRRLGRETLERLVQPLIGGIYTADPNELSVPATLPQFARMEQEHGSLLRGVARQAKHDRRESRGASGARYGLFVTLDEGMDVLSKTLASQLPDGMVRTGAAVRRLVRDDLTQRWRVELLDGTLELADAVVLATETHSGARLLESQDSQLALHLRSIPYASSVVVNVAYARDAVAHPLDGFGVVVPSIEGRKILAVSFTSIKFPSRAPANTVLFRVFIGGALQPDLCGLDDSELEAIVTKELQELLGARGTPLFMEIARHVRAMPQYTLGHLERVAAIEASRSRHPGLFITGNAFGGVGLPDCIRGAQDTARAVAAYLSDIGKAAA
jgi:oxygen-dependent protoporphyrinogen oxidase